MLDVVWSSGDLEVAVNELIQRGAELLILVVQVHR
jgi:hypothetical protein